MGKSKNNKKVVLFGAAIVIIITIILFSNKSVETIEIMNSKYEEKVSFKGFYFVEERVVSENVINRKDLNFKEGDLVPKNGKITNIISAPEAGMISTKVDGYEGKYDLKNIKKISLKEINEMISSKSKKAGIKIVNNSEWYICCYVEKNDFKGFKKGMARDIAISDNYYRGEIIDTFSNSKENYIIFRVKNDIDISRLERGFEGFIVKARYEGFIIPQKAIIEYNGDKGVFVVLNGYAQFRKVKVLTINDDEAIIAPVSRGAKVKEYDDVICNPKGITAGSRVK